MNATIVRKAEAVFAMIVEAPECDRAAALDDYCGVDGQLRALVEELLEEDGADRAGPLDAALPRAHTAPLSVDQQALTHIGPYRIIRTLGEGGMAVVYEARQENPRRTVAVKVIRGGMTSREVQKRFLHEVHVLGQLRHPGIAQIYEAGVAPVVSPGGGRGQLPYFAMELVRGDNLTRFAERARLTVQQRLELLARVCDAVQYAHQRGVIHRDLKPANIIVEESAAEHCAGGAGLPELIAQPKVLDFGVARVTGQDIQTPTMATRAGQVIGTLAYMSPEQLLGDVEQTDTRSDVYALGVILYQLLTGKLPYDLDEIPLPEVARRIREADPPRLSEIDRRLRGDIEVIAARALEKDRGRRYQSARDLAGDIRRHLRGEAIEARRDSAVYVMRKTLSRNSGLAAVVSLVVIGVVCFAVYAGLQAQRLQALSDDEHRARVNAEEARAEADASLRSAKSEAEKARKVSAFLGGILKIAGPSPERQKKTLTDLLDEASARLESGTLADSPDVEQEVRETLAETYSRLALSAGAVKHRLWLAERARVRDGETSKKYAASLAHLTSAYNEASLQHEAESSARRALEIYRQASGPDAPETLAAMDWLGNTLMRLGRCEEAIKYSEEATRMIARTRGAASLRAGLAYFNLAGVYRGLGKLDEMEAQYLRALPILEAKAPESVNTIRCRYTYALDCLVRRGRSAEAVPHLRETLKNAERVLGATHPETLIAKKCLADALTNLKDEAGAIILLEDICRAYRSQEHWVATGEGVAEGELARLYAKNGRIEQAREIYSAFQAKTDRVQGSIGNVSIRGLVTSARIEQDYGDRDLARELGQEILLRAFNGFPVDDGRAPAVIRDACRFVEPS